MSFSVKGDEEKGYPQSYHKSKVLGEIYDSLSLCSDTPSSQLQMPKIHTCRYSKAMNQLFPRKCVDCGKPEDFDDSTVEITPPVHSDFVIKNGVGLNGGDGTYYHFSNVVSMLKAWDKKMTVYSFDLLSFLQEEIKSIDSELEKQWEYLGSECKYKKMEGIEPFIIHINKLNARRVGVQIMLEKFTTDILSRLKTVRF